MTFGSLFFLFSYTRLSLLRCSIETREWIWKWGIEGYGKDMNMMEPSGSTNEMTSTGDCHRPSLAIVIAVQYEQKPYDEERYLENWYFSLTQGTSH